MASGDSAANAALPLHEVLEAEFLALHGELPANYPHSGDEKTRLKAIWSAIHQREEKRAALCISGGGIRSATFGLGVIQGLTHCGLLEKFHYLSTVSGGGYIGSWLSAWISHHPQGLSGVVEELERRPESALHPEPDAIRHLREFSNYLSPRTGVTSVDFWTLIATFVRNMFLNWLVLISLLSAVMMIPRLYLAAIVVSPDWSLAKTGEDALRLIESWNTPLDALLVIGFALIAIAMAYAIVDVPSTGNLRLSQRCFLIFRQIPLLFAALILAEWWALHRTVHGGELFIAANWLPKFVVFFLGAFVVGGLLALAGLAWWNGDVKNWLRQVPASLSRLSIVLVAAAVAGLCLWAVAVGMFLQGPIPFVVNQEFEPTMAAAGGQQLILEAGTEGKITRIDPGYVIQWDQKEVRIPATEFGPLNLQPDEKLPVARKLKRTFEVLPTPDKPEKLPAGKQVLVSGLDPILTIETPNGQAQIGEGGIAAALNLPVKDLPDQLPTPAPASNALAYVCLAPALILTVLLLVNFLFTGLASWATQDEDREWWGRSAAWILITVMVWLVLTAVVLWGAQAIAATSNHLDVFLGDVKATPEAKGLLGAFAGISALASALLALRGKIAEWLGEKAAFQWLLILVAASFLVLLSIVISWLLVLVGSQPWASHATNWFTGGTNALATSWRVQLFVVVFLTAAMLLFGIAMGFFINANKFSLHATYRNRLIRAYLAASRKSRTPNRFTGFDPDDNIPLAQLHGGRPFHILNGALNLVHGDQLGWQERKAESFTMTRLHCGSWQLGYRPAEKYGEAISLGTAMAISGAAANPNMGYHSSPIVAFLLTLFNVRLGWWLGNPGRAGEKTWMRKGPRYSVGPLFSEALGNTTDRYKYVNLSDGGHFENLGLYEVVLRRCHFIVVSDGGEDPECSFVDLGEAVRKIRIDFGIPIEFGPMSIYSRNALASLKGPGHNCAIGRIRYSVVDGDGAPDGVLVYIKPACYGDEPRDIYEYFKSHPTFPHESTSDQFFSESQFESYRMLGCYTMTRICPDHVRNFSEFNNAILRDHLMVAVPEWMESRTIAAD